MKKELYPVIRKHLSATAEFKDSNVVWWPPHWLDNNEVIDLKENFKTVEHERIDEALSLYRNHGIADHYKTSLRADAIIRPRISMPKPSKDIIQLDDLLRLKDVPAPKLLRAKSDSWNNLQEGWKYFTANLEDVFDSTADYLFHGYVNEQENDFITFILIKWNHGLRDLIVAQPDSPDWLWRHLGKTGLFWCMKYDSIIRLYPELVVHYNMEYWAKNGTNMNLGRVPIS
jgi:hypothetical protein